MNPKKVKTDKKFQAWPCTTTRCGCELVMSEQEWR